MNGIEQVKQDKEIKNIVLERDKTQRLLNEANWDELQAHLRSMSAKYYAETFVYNIANPNPPKSIQENAQNCISFLNTLLAAKIVDVTKSDMDIR